MEAKPATRTNATGGGRTSARSVLEPFAVAAGGTLVRGMRGGDGPNALLLHGTAGSWRNFRPWLPALLPRAHLLIPDLPGFGQSSAPPIRPGLTEWALLLHQAMAELGAPPRILIGLGMGASVAMAYLAVGGAALYDHPLTHVVLHTPVSHGGAIRPAIRWGVRCLGARAVFSLARPVLESKALQHWWVRKLVAGPDISPEDADILEQDFERANLSVLRGIVMDMVNRDFRAVLRAQATPTLIIVGESDPLVDPREVVKAGQLMLNARVRTQTGLGHGWSTEAVASHQRWLAEFLDDGGAQRD
jgi:pimeloyl-ACP methyl ester carboxylesterase